MFDIYDCCISDKLIIEYDSSGYYHQNKEYDDKKEIIAIKAGYKFLRINLEQSKDIETLNLIKTILEND